MTEKGTFEYVKKTLKLIKKGYPKVKINFISQSIEEKTRKTIEKVAKITNTSN